MARKLNKSTSNKLRATKKRRLRVRKTIIGTAERPRLCVTKTNRSLYVQIINDDTQVTLIGVRSDTTKPLNLTMAKELGKTVAQKASSQGLKSVVFDRSGNFFHGRVKALAEGAREGGLLF